MTEPTCEALDANSTRERREPGTVYWDDGRGVWSAALDLPRQPGEPRRRRRRSAPTETEARVLLEEMRAELVETGTVAPVVGKPDDGYQRQTVEGGWRIRVPGAWCAVSFPNPEAVPRRIRSEMRAVHDAVRALGDTLDRLAASDESVTEFETVAVKTRTQYQGARE